MPLPDRKLIADERVSEWFAREKARTERKETIEPGRLPVLTISRQPGTEGELIAAEIAKRFTPPWTIWDKELIQAIAEHASVRTQMVQAVEQNHSSFQHVIEQLLGITTLDQGGYRSHLTLVLFAIASQKGQIIVGRGANFILKDAINVCLKASHEYRLNKTMEQTGLCRDKADSAMKHAEKERLDFIKNVFHKDADDDSCYDLVINVDKLGFDVTISAIYAALKSYYKLV